MSNARVQLARVTGDELSDNADAEAVAAAGYRQVLGPAPASANSKIPSISDAAQALLIMCGCQARFVINYWKITRLKEPGQAPVGMRLRPGQKYREQTGVSADAPFSEWQKVLANFTGEIDGDK